MSSSKTDENTPVLSEREMKKREYMKQWRQSERGKQYYKEYNKKWRDEHPEQVKERKKREYEKNKYGYNERRRSVRQFYRDQMFAIVGDKCVWCGFSDRRALQFDHKEGEGTKQIHREELKDYHMYRKYIKNPELARKKFQTLCANCNQIKRYLIYKGPLKNIIQ